MNNADTEIMPAAKRVFHDGRDWFFEKRFGLFVHWGLYAVNAWHEQEQFRKGLSRCDYTHLIDKFDPANFNPESWLDIAEKAGMQYVCFTAKHIDGFCMWNTKQTEYNITNTPYRKDIFGMLAEVCHRRNFPICIYYSVPDMNCRYYPNQGRSYELPGPEHGDEPNLAKYIDFVKAQVTELCTNYGKIHGFWWDANSGTLKHRDESVNKLIRSLQPGIIINNRGFDDGDFSTPERDYDDAALGGTQVYAKPTEACEAIGAESWGYRSNEDYFSVGALTGSICRHMAKGGNYLLNVGPKADGTFPSEAVMLLERIGKWYQTVRDAFENVEPFPVAGNKGNALFGRKDNVVYVYLPDTPKKTGVTLNPINILPKKATVLNNGQVLKTALERMPTLWQDKKEYLHVWNLPVNELSNEAMILKLEFEEEVTEALG
jgi:alpha-L-fucosidase